MPPTFVQSVQCTRHCSKPFISLNPHPICCTGLSILRWAPTIHHTNGTSYPESSSLYRSGLDLANKRLIRFWKQKWNGCHYSSCTARRMGRQRIPSDSSASFSYLDNSDLRFLSKWITKLEKSNTSSKTVLAVQALGEEKSENWGMAATNRATDRQTPAGAKDSVSKQTYRNQSQLGLCYPGGG